MIRMVLFALGFVAITIALVIVQPGSGRKTALDDAPMAEPVTRAEPALMPVSPEVQAAPQARPALVVPQPVPPAGGVALDDQKMRQMTWDTLSSLNHATGREAAPGQPGSLLHTIVRRSLDAPGGAVGQPLARVPDVYVVQPGDSLVSIADKIYGDVNMTGPLFAANQAILSRPDDLRAGQSLVLPSR